MKTKLIISITILLFLVAIVANKDSKDVNNSMINIFNPIKIWYIDMSKALVSGIEDSIFQAQTIEKLRNENATLQKNILSQKNYIEQSKQIKNLGPYISKIPLNTIVTTTQTISYTKMNNFTEVLLTKPTLVHEGVPYGLIENGVVAGVAKMVNGHLYGYLTANEKCRFSVNIGSKLAPGVAIGDGNNGMTIQFIPRIFPIKAGDRVVTSGLDGIFYSNIPVGIIKRVEIQSSYKVAYMDTYNDLYHPEIFFLLSGKKPTIFTTSHGLGDIINGESVMYDTNSSLGSPSSLSSTPLVEMDQTKTDTIVPEQTVMQNKPKRKKRVRKPAPVDDDNIGLENDNMEATHQMQESETATPDRSSIGVEQSQPLP